MDVMEREMENGVEPEQIAFVSFTRKATSEAMTRVLDRFKLRATDFPYVRTLHSLAYMQLGITQAEVMREKDYVELGSYLGLEFSGKIVGLEENASNDNTRFSGDKYVYLDGFARNRKLTPEKAWEQVGSYDLNWFEFERFHRALREYKIDNNLIDFSDLLEAQHHPLPVKVAIIDEAQDLSTLQWKFALEIFSQAERIYIAGDDDQAIYTWSGADVRYFLNIPGERTILHQSHRVPRAIHRVAEEIAGRIETRISKNYAPRDGEGHVEYHSDMHNIDFSSGTWLLLARNGYMLGRLSKLVRDQGYLYSYRGDSIINKEHLAAITAWTKWRKVGAVDPMEHILIEKYLPPGLEKWPDIIWHEALERIPLEDREFYISLLRNGERITQQPRINISTIHGVKGGEADHVLLLTDTTVKARDGMFVQPDAEHRVWYVAATRARESLHVIMPQSSCAYDI